MLKKIKDKKKLHHQQCTVRGLDVVKSHGFSRWLSKQDNNVKLQKTMDR